MIRIQDILDEASTYLPAPDVALIQKAYVFSAAAHAGQVRLSGEPYLSHPLEVSAMLTQLRLDAATIIAGLLHDTVEDTDANIAQISEQFGAEVGAIVEGVTKIGKMNFESKEQAQAENIRKMILAMADDIRVILVKLADRLHNISTLEFQKEHKQKSIAQETLSIYAPLANRLGLYRTKIQLENLSLKYLKPEIYAQISEGIERYQEQGQTYIDKVCAMIRDQLHKNEIKGRVGGRIKHIYSIYHKMQQRGLSLDQVFDMIAFRVVVGNLRECYSVLGLVHALWKPVPGKFKDYISMPKANMYQSLHSTVIGPEGERIEIQIRTEEMHRLAENGVAAHWAYKEHGSQKAQDAERFAWLRQILDWQGDLKDSRDFMSTLSLDLFQDEVYVFTPQGQVKELPEEATPVDFAYLIHSEVGNHCAGARVNGRIVPLNTALKSGDTVEIITDASRNPSRDWLQFVKSGKARSRIKHWINTEERERSLTLARELLDKEGRRMGINVGKAMKNGEFESVAREFSFRQVDDLLASIGHGRITARQALRKLLSSKDDAEDRKQAEAPAAAASSRPADPDDALSIRGADGMLTRYAQCCRPLPGDPIIGYISRGLGLTIHAQDCPNVPNMEVDRLLSVSWGDQEATEVLTAKINVICKNQQGSLGQVCTLLAKEGINIDSGEFKSGVDGRTHLSCIIEVKTSRQLYAVLDKLHRLDAVHEVTRSEGE